MCLCVWIILHRCIYIYTYLYIYMYNASISRYPQVQVFLDMHVCKKVFLPDTFIEYVYIYIYTYAMHTRLGSDGVKWRSRNVLIIDVILDIVVVIIILVVVRITTVHQSWPSCMSHRSSIMNHLSLKSSNPNHNKSDAHQWSTNYQFIQFTSHKISSSQPEKKELLQKFIKH